jgi:DNA-binding NarL/FixJ family response regulator
MGQPVRVMVADDNEMVRMALAILIETFDDLQLVAEASDGMEAVELCQQIHPDVVIMDIHMPNLNGVEATKSIKQLSEDVRVVVLTSSIEDEVLQDALKAGADGFLYKNISSNELYQTITSIA